MSQIRAKLRNNEKNGTYLYDLVGQVKKNTGQIKQTHYGQNVKKWGRLPIPEDA